MIMTCTNLQQDNQQKDGSEVQKQSGFHWGMLKTKICQTGLVQHKKLQNKVLICIRNAF